MAEFESVHYPHCNDRCDGDSHWLEGDDSEQDERRAAAIRAIEKGVETRASIDFVKDVRGRG